MLQSAIVVSCLFCVAVVDARGLRTHDSKDIGVQLAKAVQSANAGLAGKEDPTNFQKLLFAELVSKEELLVNEAVAKAVMQANRAAESKSMETELCDTNWDAACPDGWAVLAGTCQAPAAYSGCAAQQPTFQSKQEKMEFAASCSAPWPCKDSCVAGHDYDSCPSDFVAVGGGLCSATEAVCGQTVFNFEAMPLPDRIALGVACGFQWPCHSGVCKQDFQAVCPAGWREVEGLCVAPASYAGPCSYSVKASGMSPSQKEAFGSKCAVSFPCVE